jgi:hypothetical protein
VSWLPVVHSVSVHSVHPSSINNPPRPLWTIFSQLEIMTGGTTAGAHSLPHSLITRTCNSLVRSSREGVRKQNLNSCTRKTT